MNETRFAHAADLRIDAPLKDLGSGNYNPRISQLLTLAPTIAFKRLIESCVSEKLDFLVLTGEIFTQNPVDPHLRSLVGEGLKKLALAGIHVFISQPITDPLFLPEREELQEKITFLEPDRVGTTSVMRGQETVAKVKGIGQDRLNSQDKLLPLVKNDNKESCLQVAILPIEISEQGVDGRPGIAIKDLAQTGLDVIISTITHSRAILNDLPFLAYPGSMSLEVTDDQGSFGCLKVKATQNGKWHCHADFLTLSPIAMETVELDLEGIHDAAHLSLTLAERLHNIRNLASEDVEGIITGIKIYGQTPLNSWLRSPAFRESLKEILNHFANGKPAILVTAPQILTVSPPTPEGKGNLLSDLYKTVNELSDNPEELSSFADQCFAPLLANPEMVSFLQLPTDSKELASLLKGAEYICQHALEEK